MFRKLKSINTAHKVMLSSTLMLILSGCASTYQEPESFDEKMARFQARNLSLNTVPNFKVAHVPLEIEDKKNKGQENKAQSQRGPASIGIEKNSPFSHEIEISTASNFSNRHLYFMTLYTQYQELKSFVDQESSPSIQFCPAFHTSFLQKKNQATSQSRSPMTYQPSPDITIERMAHSDYQALYPELMLPVTKEELTPTVADYFQSQKHKYVNSPQEFEKALQETVTKSLEIHLSKTYHELNELCEYGQSDNYYVYENLITFSRRSSNFSPSTKNMQTLLRTTLFSNMALTHSLASQSRPIVERGRSIASIEPSKSSELSEQKVFDSEVMERTNSAWSQNYFKSIIRHR